MNCTRDFKSNCFDKAIVLCGKLFQGWFRSIGVKEESTQPVCELQMHSIFLQSRFSLDSICKASWRKPSEELNSSTSWVKSHHQCWELLYYVTLGCMTILVQGVYVKLWFVKVVLLMLMRLLAKQFDPCRPHSHYFIDSQDGSWLKLVQLIWVWQKEYELLWYMFSNSCHLHTTIE
jgi:hypothetical protein